MKLLIIRILCLLSLFSLQGCQSPSEDSITEYSVINDRTHRPLYHAIISQDWLKEDPSPQASLEDTMKPICTLQIEDIKITVHNFPSSAIEQRIPPQAQIQRWKKQFSPLDEESVTITPVGHSGFLGAQFEASGLIDGKETATLAWIMQLAPEHYYSISSRFPQDTQRKADWTIKAVGPKESLEKHKQSLLLFAQSFELIDEIP